MSAVDVIAGRTLRAEVQYVGRRRPKRRKRTLTLKGTFAKRATLTAVTYAREFRDFAVENGYASRDGQYGIAWRHDRGGEDFALFHYLYGRPAPEPFEQHTDAFDQWNYSPAKKTYKDRPLPGLIATLAHGRQSD